MSSILEATRDAHIICTATPATTPLIDFLDVKPGVHINAVGSHSEDMCEVGAQLIGQAKVVVDQRIAALAEAGEIIQCMRAGLMNEAHLIELGDLILDPSLGRTTANQITIFKSVGLAIQDISVAQYALKVASEKNLGVVVAF